VEVQAKTKEARDSQPEKTTGSRSNPVVLTRIGDRVVYRQQARKPLDEKKIPTLRLALTTALAR
jgi:hypothetical protein